MQVDVFANYFIRLVHFYSVRVLRVPVSSEYLKSAELQLPEKAEIQVYCF